MDIFNNIGWILGYILWACYMVVKNYGIAIILFTIVIKILMFPLSIKQQKSMASNSKMAAKQQELRKKYANDKAKLNEEINNLYAKEGASPTGGCLTMMVPMLLLLGVYYAVINPLTNTLHIAGEVVTSTLGKLTVLPGIGTNYMGFYGQMDIIGLAQKPEGMNFLSNFFNQSDLTAISEYGQSFNFLGLNLLEKPNEAFGAGNWVLLLIPILCFLSSMLSQFFTMRIQGTGGQQQGCMKAMMFLMPLFSAYIAFTVPSAVGFYWIISTVIGFAQTVFLQKFYSVGHMTAKQEAQRVALLEQQESTVKYFYSPKYENKGIANLNVKKKKKK